MSKSAVRSSAKSVVNSGAPHWPTCSVRSPRPYRGGKVAAALSAPAQSLLRAAALDVGFDLVTETAIRAVARTIAALDGQAEIGASHICEAINYRSLEGLAVTSQPRRVRGPAGKQAA
jgi:hypothetical protein